MTWLLCFDLQDQRALRAGDRQEVHEPLLVSLFVRVLIFSSAHALFVDDVAKVGCVDGLSPGGGGPHLDTVGVEHACVADPLLAGRDLLQLFAEDEKLLLRRAGRLQPFDQMVEVGVEVPAGVLEKCLLELA